MDAYIYAGELYCEDCGEKIREEIEKTKCEPIEREDSDYYPLFVLHGGGEADSPNHCGHCCCHLENPLTEEGYQYVIDSILKHFSSNGRFGDRDTLQEWVSFYDISLDDLFQEVEGRKGIAKD